MIRLQKINDVEVEPVALPAAPKNILGCDLFPKLNANIFICAPKESGKTVTIKKIIDECVDQDTHVVIFCGTIHNDAAWKAIKEDLRKRKIKFSAYSSLFTENNTNVLDILIDTLQDEGSDSEEDDDRKIPKGPIILTEEVKETKEKKKKYESPDYLIIFDDLSTELKNPSIPKLMKIHRHFRTKIIISSQSWVDTPAGIRKGNLDYVLLFQRIPEEVLQQIYQELSIPIKESTFLKLYYHATSQKYHFLYINTAGHFRRDFSSGYQLGPSGGY